MSGSTPHSRRAAGVARVFFALWPLGAAADAITDRVAQTGIDGRSVAPERLHLTLAFHGRCGPARINALMRRAQAIDCEAFDLVIDRLDCFCRGGVVWVGPAAPPPLSVLAARLSAEAGSGIEAARFKPHVTVAHKSACPGPAIFPSVHLAVTSFALVASGEDGRPGAYRELARWPLH